jgi:hypothetical protein
MFMWLCAIFGTVLLGAGVYGGMKWFGTFAARRDDAERARLAEEWKRRAAARKAKLEGTAPAADDDEGSTPSI